MWREGAPSQWPRARPVLLPFYSSDLAKPRRQAVLWSAFMGGGHRGRGSQEQSWKSSWAESGASAFEGPGNQPWVNRSQTWLMHLMTQ